VTTVNCALEEHLLTYLLTYNIKDTKRMKTIQLSIGYYKQVVGPQHVYRPIAGLHGNLQIHRLNSRGSKQKMCTF